MEKNVVKNILADIDLRQNLIKLKGSMTAADTLDGPIVEKLCDCLSHEDPKVRKNAALLLGYTKNSMMASVLLDAYKNEEKDFVKIDYENIKKGKYEILEDDLLTTQDGTIKHDSLKLSSIIFSYLMR